LYPLKPCLKLILRKKLLKKQIRIRIKELQGRHIMDPKVTLKRSRTRVCAVDGMPLHSNDVEVGAVHVERVADVVGDPLIDKPHLHDVADVDLKLISIQIFLRL